MSLSHMTKCNLIRAEGLTVCSVRLTTKTVPGIVFSLHSDSLNFIIYDGHTVLWSELGLRRISEWYLISLWGHPFSSWGIKDHQCVTALMWSEAVEGGGGRICRLAQRHTWNLDPFPLRPCWQMGESRAQLPRSTPALATHWANTDSVYHSLFAVDGHFPLSPVPPHRVPLFGRRD